MRSQLLAGATAIALAAMAQHAEARLQLSINVGGTTFTCFDGETSCDQSGGANNLLVIDQTIGGAFVQITLAQSAFGAINSLQLSSSNIENTSGAAITVKLLASDTSFVPPTTFIRDSGSLTFNSAVGSGQSSLGFWADVANTQGANPNNTPGTLLEQVFGTPATNPDSFAGSNLAAFLASNPFSMTEGASLNLVSGGSITGFNQSMTSGIPEPKTWALMAIGFAALSFLGFKKRKTERYAL
jgi:hypothetical protein